MGGSIRLPAHFCGIVGIKPTSGRVPHTGTFPWPDGWLDMLWQNGPLARYVEDLILTLNIISGTDWKDASVMPMSLGDPRKINLKNLHLAVFTDNGIISPTKETISVVKKAADTLSEAGSKVDESIPKGIEQSFELFTALGAADSGVGIKKLLKKTGTTEVHPWIQALLDFYSSYSMTTADVSSLMLRWSAFRNTMLSFMEQYDGIICPVCAFPAQPHGTTLKAEKIFAFSYTITYNLTGWPGVVIRGGTSPEGLPIGVQIVSRPWREDVALAIAKYLEKKFGNWQPPSVSGC
ncbi:MAG: amidase, partial [Candidatus Bathyarchaeota archaeon]|jgi:amidase